MNERKVEIKLRWPKGYLNLLPLHAGPKTPKEICVGKFQRRGGCLKSSAGEESLGSERPGAGIENGNGRKRVGTERSPKGNNYAGQGPLQGDRNKNKTDRGALGGIMKEGTGPGGGGSSRGN